MIRHKPERLYLLVHIVAGDNFTINSITDLDTIRNRSEYVLKHW